MRQVFGKNAERIFKNFIPDLGRPEEMVATQHGKSDPANQFGCGQD